MKRVEIFKTAVQHKYQAEKICAVLIKQLKNSKINFDLDDCDKILRIESTKINPNKVRILMENMGYSCEIITQ